MVPKFGKKFEDVSKLFDHAAHNGLNQKKRQTCGTWDRLSI